jgi:hypothetical protein
LLIYKSFLDHYILTHDVTPEMELLKLVQRKFIFKLIVQKLSRSDRLWTTTGDVFQPLRQRPDKSMRLLAKLRLTILASALAKG